MLDKIKKVAVEEFTSPDPTTVGPDALASEVLNLMKDNGFRHIPVVESHRAIGIISDRDLLMAQTRSGAESLTARDVMTPNPFSVQRKTSLEQVALELSARKVGSAIVTGADGKLYGIFTATDALNALVEILRGEILK